MTGRWSGLKKEGFKQCEVMVTRARTAIIYRFMIKGGRKEKEEGEKRKEKKRKEKIIIDLMTDLLIEIELQAGEKGDGEIDD